MIQFKVTVPDTKDGITREQLDEILDKAFQSTREGYLPLYQLRAGVIKLIDAYEKRLTKTDSENATETQSEH